MALIGLGTVTIVALVLAVRSSLPVNKMIAVLLWGGYAAYSTGVL